jgi:periplasmic protein TonB
MLPSVKNSSGAKTKVPSKREEKKRINIRWNSGIFFQVGLIVSLLLFLAIIESDWKLSSGNLFISPTDMNLDETYFLAYRLEEPIVETLEPQKTIKNRIIRKPVMNIFKTFANTDPTLETNMTPTEIEPNVRALGSTGNVPVKESGPSNVNTVQFVPLFPGCESLSNNTERKRCMSSKLNSFINRKFNSDKFSYMEVGKIHTINVMFTIGKDGKVKDILAKAKLPELEKEAIRVIGKLPFMKPGKQGNTKVDVQFIVPIMFQVQ